MDLGLLYLEPTSKSLFISRQFRHSIYELLAISVAARSKAWVCGRSLAGIAGSNAAGCLDVCLC